MYLCCSSTSSFLYEGVGQVLFSKYAHLYRLGNDVVLINSLRLKPVYLSYNKFITIKEFLESGKECDFDELVELKKYKIVIENQKDDSRILGFVKSHAPRPAVSVCYFILSEQCNLACKYCFLGNNDKEKRKHFYKQHMSQEVADKAIFHFIEQLEWHQEHQDLESVRPVVIFYGGEPLLNYDVLKYVVKRFNQLKEEHELLKNIEFSVVTNGLLLDEEKLRDLHDLKVSIAISIDGCDEKSNSMRVDTNGNPAFGRIVKVLDRIKELGVPVSLSITLTEESIKNKQKMIDLIKRYEIKGLGFNILMSDANFILPESYSVDAANFIVDMFKTLRELGVYEDRIMRKLNAFVNSQVYYSDCAATAASQIVVAANGDIGICHGCLADRKYFNHNVSESHLNLDNDLIWNEWSTLSPIYKDECQECEALGICGGGCPINALKEKEGNTIHSMDRRFCVHSKACLEFFLEDLYRIIFKKKKKKKKISL